MTTSAALKGRVAALASGANRRAITSLVRRGQIPRIAFQHYFIETDGLHSRIMLQNYWSTFWPNLRHEAPARIDVYAPDGARVGRLERVLRPFGSLFLEMRDVFAEIRTTLDEGTVTIDVEPPAEALHELGEFPLPEPWALRISTPFWMAYYDAGENYMYVHSIDRHVGEFYGVPAPVGWLLSRHFGGIGTSWRGGRLIDHENLRDLQIVAINHGAAARSATVGIFDWETDDRFWSVEHHFAPHSLKRFRVPLDGVAGRRRQFRIGVDPLPTLNGKPYVLMRYGDGPLSLHHG